MSNRAILILRILPALAWMAVIAYSSSQAQPLGRGVAAPTDSFGHFTEYAVLFALLWLAVTAHRSWRESPVAAFAIAGAISIVFAASDEVHQLFVEGRHGSTQDFAVDILGVVASAAALKSGDTLLRGAIESAVTNRRRRHQSRSNADPVDPSPPTPERDPQ